MTEEELQQLLEDNGCPRHIVQAGRAGLRERWQAFVSEIEAGYPYGLEEYRNDLDIRAMISLAGMDDEPEIQRLDERFEQMLTDREQRVWESSAEHPFWDFGYPRNATGRLHRDLRSAGLVE